MSSIVIQEPSITNKMTIYKNGIYYDFNIEDINCNKVKVYINNKYELLEDILYTIKSYYIKQLSLKLEFEEDEFIFNFNIYKENICKIYIYLLDLFQRTEEIKETIEDKIQKLINKPLKYIVYESSWCNEELLLPQMLRINDTLNRDITLEKIISDIYEYEISKINTNLPNTIIGSGADDELLYCVEQNISYISAKDIINRILTDLISNIPKMEKLKEIFSLKIYEHICMYKNVDETKIVSLYCCLDIKYVKIIIDMKDNNVVWIMRKLNMLTNKYIPTFYIDNKLTDIINHNIEDKIITIKYNRDASTSQQFTKYLIDKLYNSLMESELNKKY